MIFVSGANTRDQLGEKANAKNPSRNSIISPPCNSHIDINSLLSYSAYDEHSVLITKDGKLLAIGNNENSQISGGLSRKVFKEFTEFNIKNSKGKLCTPHSAVCGIQYTLYMVSNPDDISNFQIALSFEDKNEEPIFLNFGDRHPICIFGGGFNAAVIDSEYGISIINENIFQSPTSVIKPSLLPNNEKAISVACCDDIIYALSFDGKVFQSTFSENNKLNFIEVSELKDFNIVDISGTHDHCFAVTSDGKVFGKGSNSNGKLGIGKRTKQIDSFIEIKTLNDRKIKSTYAGQYHSLFITKEGKILACGGNYNGELLSNIKPSKDYFYSPIETVINSGATFCIAGGNLSIAFINADPPVNSPNKKIVNKLINNNNSDELKELKKLLSLKEKEIKKLKNEIASLKKNKKEIKVFGVDEIEQFDHLEELGEGGQSKVIKTSKYYVLKIMKTSSDYGTNLNNFKRFLQEYEMLNQIDHPNIIKTFGFCYGDKKHQPTILLEFCPYSLNKIVNTLNDKERVSIIYEICLAMKHVHEANIIHRDLSPENILLDNKKHVKISDFGIATLMDSETQSKTSGIGKLKFMAPELIREKTHYNEKVDVFSFSVVLFYILTKGSIPDVSIIDVGLGKRSKIPYEINKLSASLITKCWSDNPNERPSFSEIIDLIKRNNFKLIDNVDISIS